MNRQIDPVTRTLLRLAGAGTALALAGCTYRDLSRQPEAGRDYRTVTPPVGKVPAGKVEVVEFFWYGCPFCRAFEPRLKAWYAQQARDLSLRIVHPVPNDGWQPAAKLYFSLQELGLAERLNQDIYGAIVDGQRGLDGESDALAVISSLGVDPAAFTAAYRSQRVQSLVADATSFGKAVGLDSVPSLAVNGRWYTSAGMAGGIDNLLWVLDHLVAMARRGG
ncbi:MAG: thiol:disulfide interchange protein DsbA/DsbL [Quisquiliibacterium sp.]